MKRDIRETALYGEIEALHEQLRRPGAGQISDALDLHASPDGRRAVFAAVMVDVLERAAETRIWEIDLESGSQRALTFGPNTDRLPRYSPLGSHVAFLSDRHEAGDFQLYLLDLASSAALRAPCVEGWVEYLHWSPDGKRVLLGVSGHGADVAGSQGAVRSARATRDSPSWMPTVESGGEDWSWRSAWVYDVASHTVSRVSGPEQNVWEAAWSGDNAIAAIVSSGPEEGLWYHASLQLLDTRTLRANTVYEPQDQLGWPAGSPCGRYLAVVEAVCSDRWIVAGELRLIDLASKSKIQRVETNGVDVTHLEWRTDTVLFLLGQRGFETVAALYDVRSGLLRELWASNEITSAGFCAKASGIGPGGDFVLVGEGFLRAPEIAVIRSGRYEPIRSFDLGYADCARAIQRVDRVTWQAPDGIEIQGWLLRPNAAAPHPLVMNIHGGPVGHWRPAWLGRRGVHMLILLKQGYAVFLPNPRGSSGRGQDFVRRVVGDIGGADTYDFLSGLDHLVQSGVADPTRLGVTGGSYGGFMTSWLITQDDRFAAAVPVAPVTNQVTEHLISNIPHFVKMFLADDYTNAGGKYVLRSPIMYAGRVKTPTLNICGALDRCTPPEEAVQFHNALRESGVRSVLVVYPEEGHGILKFPAVIDYASRVASWFMEHMPVVR